MDREGFRNRFKQYKKAREENPGLKYWEWRDTPKYNEGTVGVRDNTYVAPIEKEQVFIPATGARKFLQDFRKRNPRGGNLEIVSPEFDILTGLRAIATLPTKAEKLGREIFRSSFIPDDKITDLINAKRISDLTTFTKKIKNDSDWYVHTDLGKSNSVFAGKGKGAYIQDKHLHPGEALIFDQKPYVWWNQGKRYSRLGENEHGYLTIIIKNNNSKDLLQVKSSQSPIGLWNGKQGFVLPSEYVTHDAVNLTPDIEHYVYDGLTKTYGNVKHYEEGGEVGDKKVIPTQEEYIAEQIAARKATALEKSLSRTMPRVPQGIKIGERWNPVTKKVEDIHECGPSCAYTFSDNYGLNWMGSEDFKQNHANYGWKQVPWEQRQPGNAVLIVDDSGTAKHTMMYDSDNAQGQPLFNHSNGGHDESAIRKKAKYPHHNPYLTYEFVGTPADSTQWINDYKKIYGLAEGGEVEPNKYRIVTKDPTLKSEIQSAIDWTNKWHAARKATGKFDDQYKSTEPYSTRPVAILPSNIGDAAGTFTGSQKSSLVRVNPDVTPQWGNSLESAVVHELGHETSIENAAAKMSADRAKSSAIVKKVSEITGSPEFHTTEQGSDYYNTAAEEYARLQQMRHAMNADPTKEYSLPELKSWLKQYQLPADERGVRLMNDVAMVDFNPDGILMLNEGGIIKIKEKNKGKFTESAKRAGMGVLEFAKHVLANKDDYSSTQVKRANFARNATKWKHAEGTDQVKSNRYSERPIVDYNPITGETVYGYNPGAGFLSAEDPIASDVMMGITGVRITPMLRKLFPHYGGTFGAMMFGDSGKSADRDNENMLIIPNSNTKLDRPISTNVLNTDLRRYYADDVLPRDVITSDHDKLSFLNTDKNFQYDLYPLSHFNPGVAGYFNHKDNKIRLNNQYSDNKDLLDNIMAHEVNHRYNSEFPLDKKHNRILNNAYTVESDLNTPIARAARRGSEKRATNVNIRHRLQTDLRNRLGRVPTKTEMDKFIDSLSDKELLDRLGHSNAYGAAYLLSIEDRADLVNQPVDQYKKARVTKLKRALKRIAMNETENDNNQNYA